MALGPVNHLRQEVSAAVAAPVAEATSVAQAQDIATADETGGVQGNGDGANPQRRNAWLWVRVTTWVTVLQRHLTRGQGAAKQVVGTCAGVLITDRWTGYGWGPLARRQLCWAHVIRAFPTIAERDKASQRVGEGVLAQARPLWAWWHRVREGPASRAECAAAVVAIRARVQQWLTEGAAYDVVRGDTSVRAKTARTCRALLKVAPALWLFVHVHGVEPTHNAAERALRPAVLWRRTRLGTQSALGSQCVARLMTVTRTLRSQQRTVLEYLTIACAAARQGEPAPSVLPAPSLLEQEHHLAIAA
jgi:transposase